MSGHQSIAVHGRQRPMQHLLDQASAQAKMSASTPNLKDGFRDAGNLSFLNSHVVMAVALWRAILKYPMVQPNQEMHKKMKTSLGCRLMMRMSMNVKTKAKAIDL